jgi:hypothetical protein
MKYKITFKVLNIQKQRNNINFDKIDFRLKYIKKKKIIVLIEIKKHYQNNFENRKSLIIIEIINAVKKYFFIYNYYLKTRFNN